MAQAKEVSAFASQFTCGGQKADHKEQQDFHYQNQMTPVNLSGVAAFAADKAGSKNAKRKTEYREKIPDGITKVL